jgi:hypothetical protein
LIRIKARGRRRASLATLEKTMTASPTPARWPLFDILSQWVGASALPSDGVFLASTGEEAQRLRAHLRASPDDLRWLAGRDPGHAELLPHMLWAVGLDEIRLPLATRDAMARTCGACRAKAQCAEELAQGRAGSTYAAFCPNAPAMRMLRGG